MSEMEAGTALDALVAERVFGFWLAVNPTIPDYGESWWGPHPSSPGAWVHASCWFPRPLDGHAVSFGSGLPKFSTSLDAAWKIVDRLRFFELTTPNRPGDPLWRVVIDAQHGFAHGYGSTPALAICRAALAAIDAAAPSGG